MDKMEYLYGKYKPEPIPEITIEERVALLKLHLEDILKEPLMKRDSARMNTVLKAIDYWEHINGTI